MAQIGVVTTQVGIVRAVGAKSGKPWTGMQINQKVVVDGVELEFEGMLFPKRSFSKVENKVVELTSPTEDDVPAF